MVKQQLKNYGIDQNKIYLKCDNTSVINLTKNLIQHYRAKYIEIRHHFIRDHIQNSDIVLEFIPTKNQLADISLNHWMKIDLIWLEVS